MPRNTSREKYIEMRRIKKRNFGKASNIPCHNSVRESRGEDAMGGTCGTHEVNPQTNMARE